MTLGSILEGFGDALGSGTPLETPFGAEVGGRGCGTEKESILEGFWEGLGMALETHWPPWATLGHHWEPIDLTF